MPDRQSTFTIAFDGTAGNIETVLSALKGSIRSAVSEIQALAAKVDLFANLETDVQKAALAFDAAKQRVTELKVQIDSIKGSGGTIGADLAAQFKLAENAAASASKTFNAQVTQLSTLQSRLSAAGINTGQLAAEQLRLADALKIATAAAAQQSAKQILGFTGASDVEAQVRALTKSFDTLRLGGKLSASEIATAQGLLSQKIAEVRATVSSTSSTFKTQADQVGSFFTSIQSKVLGAAVVVGSIVAAFKAVTDEAKAFNQGIAQIGAITNLSKEQLAALGEEARTLARTIGIDVVDAVKQLGAIIASGIPPDNAIAVLAASGEAAKISQTELGTAVKLSTTLVNAFGVSTDDLNRILAIFFQSSKSGGPTLTALADDIGKLGPLAKSTNTPIEDIAAALQVMVKAGVPAGNAVNDLNQLFVKLNTAAARKELAALGITSTDLVGQLNGISKSGVPVEQILGDLGLSSARSVAGVTALTDGSGRLATALLAQAGALDAAAKAQAALADTAAEREKRLKAAFEDTAISLGTAVGAGSKYAVVLTDLLNRYNNLTPVVRDQLAQQGGLILLFGQFGPAVNVVISAYDRLTSSQSNAAAAAIQVAAAAAQSAVKLQTAVAGIQSVVAGQAALADAAVKAARESFQGFATDLQTQITALQAATTAAITDLNARAAAQIAALDHSTAAEKDTAAATLAIQTKLATDRLALIVKNNAEILTAVNAAAAAQLAAVTGNAEKTKAIDLTVNQAKLAALASYKGELAAALADAVAQEQGYVGKINTIDATRVAFNRSVQDQLTQIRNEGLSSFDQYIAKTTQIKQLLADAETEFAKGGPAALALGKTYTDQAIALAGTLKTVINADGATVISALDVQQEKVKALTLGRDQYNTALDHEAVAAVAGKNASVAAIDAITPKLRDITQQYDDLNTKVEAGLAIRITTDEANIAAAGKALDDALAAQAHIVKITADVSTIQTQIDALVANLKTGITTGADAQLQGIATALQKVAADAPQLKFKVDDALTLVDTVKTAIGKISELTPKLTVDSNVKDVQGAIDNLKLPTESTHTIHIVTDGSAPGDTSAPDTSVPDTTPIPGLARGGPVGPLSRSMSPAREAWQGLASGGFAFPRLSGIKVPGVGNEDTVPAKLQRGAFVVRKAASQFYGDFAMARLIAGSALRRLADGGEYVPGPGERVPQAPAKAPPNPYIGTNDQENLTGDISPPTLPTDAKALRKLVLNYVFDVAAAAVVDDYFFWRPALRIMSDAKNNYDFQSTDANLGAMLQAARGIGLNLGLSHNTHIGFDIDGRSWHKKLATTGIPAGLLGPLTYEYDFYAKGGTAGTDTVNALLTPGEFVVNAPRAADLGSDFLHMLNNMQVPREELHEVLGNMTSPQPPRRPVARFAEGGMVGDVWSGGATGTRTGGATQQGMVNNFNMSVNPSELFSVANVRRFLLPALNTITRRST